MILDIILIFICLITILVGYNQGALHQLFGLGTLFLALFLATPVGRKCYLWANRWLESDVGTNPSLATSDSTNLLLPLFIVLSGLILYLIFRKLFQWLEESILGKNLNSIISNKLFGSCLGVVKAVLLVVIIVTGMNYMMKLFPEATEQQRVLTDSSLIYTTISDFNPLDRLDTFFRKSHIRFKENAKYLDPNFGSQEAPISSLWAIPNKFLRYFFNENLSKLYRNEAFLQKLSRTNLFINLAE